MKRIKIKGLFVAFLFINAIVAQTSTAVWNDLYTLKSPDKIVFEEQEFTRALTEKTGKSKDYVVVYKHRFLATFTGRRRPLNEEVLQSMKRVYAAKVGDPAILEQMVSTEYEMRLGRSTVWMPMQDAITTDFLYEIVEGAPATLYTMVLMDYSGKTKKLKHTFFILEFDN